MTKRQTRQHQMFVRVRKFGITHRESFPDGSLGTAALAAVDQAIHQLEASATSKHKTMKEGLVEKATAKRALRLRIEAIAKTARIIARTSPGADSHFQLPPRQTDLAVLTAARAFLHEAQPVKEGFIKGGLSATFVEELQQATDAFAQATEGRIDGKSSSSTARASIGAAIAQGMESVTALDVLVGNVLGSQALVIGAWKKARRVEPPAHAYVEEPVLQPAPSNLAVTSESSAAPVTPAVTPGAVEDPLRRAS